MMNPFEKIEKAFEVFYNEKIVIKTKSGETMTLNANVCTDITDEPLDDNIIDSETESISVSVLEKDWPYIQKIKRGDTIARVYPKQEYVISDVKIDGVFGYLIKATAK